jgi:hypothetical protein
MDVAVAALSDVFAERHHKILPLNTKALSRGAEFAKMNT